MDGENTMTDYFDAAEEDELEAAEQFLTNTSDTTDFERELSANIEAAARRQKEFGGNMGSFLREANSRMPLDYPDHVKKVLEEIRKKKTESPQNEDLLDRSEERRVG